ncbi:MAG: hypothetical protein CMG55_07340 [Candidatus Marinimicrobia bacterium]|nr:hypothetical protein [Candidatus Neomarinimicrobiota bacterium]
MLYNKTKIFFFIFLFNTVFTQIVINEFMASNDSTIADNYGEFDDWLELANNTLSPVNLYGWYISDNDSEPLKYQFSDSLYILPDSILLLWADNDIDQGINHLNFKLDSEGEEIVLTDPNQILIDSVYFDQLATDFSYGRYPDFIGDWGTMNNSSPGELNFPHDNNQYTDAISLTPNPGLYEEGIYVSNSTDLNGIDVYYTMDGSIPDTNSNPFSEPIHLTESTVLRVIALEPGLLPSRVRTFHYLINTNYNLPIVALAIEPDNLPIGDQEYNLHVSYFDKFGELGFNTDAGIEQHGSEAPQRSFRIEFKSEYGSPHIDYLVFPNRSYTRYKRLILRNASNDRFPSDGSDNRTHLRDGIIHNVYSQLYPNGGYSSFQSVHLYINNSYWGIYHLRERQDRFYIEELFGYDDVDLLERAMGYPDYRNAIEGDWDNYDELEIFIENEDMSLPDNFEVLKNNIYYEEFLDYWILEIFMGNFDWLVNNMKFFRPTSGEDKWRWLLWDTDHGLGRDHYQEGIYWGNVETDYLSWSTGLQGPRVGEGEYNKVIRAILRNDEGRIYFINRFADLLNTTYSNENLLSVFDSLVALVSDDIGYHAERWSANTLFWDNGLNEVRDYIIHRPAHIINHIINKFQLGSAYSITLEVPDTYNGSIIINSIQINDFPWTGIYFGDTPIKIKANPYQEVQNYSWENIGAISRPLNIESLYCDTIFRIIDNQLSVNTNNLISENYFLHQNYPNPFNSITQISYNLPEKSFVDISIYDLLGQKVRTLINGEHSAGFITLPWNSKDDFDQSLSSGIYIYIIQAGDFRETKKMVLLK